MNLLIYSPRSSPRLDYTLKVFFEYIVQIPYSTTRDTSTFKSYQGPCLNYSHQGQLNPREIWIPCHEFMFKNGIRAQEISVFDYDGLPSFFAHHSPEASYPFDLLACSFYLLSLLETYLPGPRDLHGRFTAEQSFAYQNNFLHRPLVDEYGLHLVKRLTQNHPHLSVQFPVYQFTPTYDIDVSWAYLNRPIYRQMGSILRDGTKLDFKNFSRRLAVYRGRQPDPFYTFPFLEQLHEQYHLAPIFFFLLGDYHGLDRSIDYRHPAQKVLLQQLAQKYQTGIHPSIRTNHRQNQLSAELQRYEALTGNLPVHSRQHYLILNLPQTYRQLLAQGIKNDYTLGYSQMPGFRASIARPFPWYDLELEQESKLILHPFACMDYALKRSAQNEDDQIYEQIKTLITASKSVNGHLYTLWHNSSFSVLENWQGWKKHYAYILEQAVL